MAIGYVTTANTFQQWLIATQDLITTANNLTDNVGGTFYANTNLVVGNTFNVVGDTTISGNLTVSGNITLDALGFDDLDVNGSVVIANTLAVTGAATLSNTLTVTGAATLSNTLAVTANTTLSNANVTLALVANVATITSASITTLTGSANTAIYSRLDSAFTQANSVYLPSVTRLDVTHSGSSAFAFDQYTGNNPELYIRAGETIAFNLAVTGHPFLIRVSNGGAQYNTGLTHVSTTGTVVTGSSAQAQVTGTLYWKVPNELAGNTYVYQCQIHSGMVGNIVIERPNEANSAAIYANAAFLAANTASADSLAFAIALG
jgi:plastocyanin